MKSKKWIFTLSRRLDEEEKETFCRVLADRLAEWKAHGQSVIHQIQVIDHKFLEITAYSYTSGCSMDWLFRVVKEVAKAFHLGPLGNEFLTFLSPQNDFLDIAFYELESAIQDGVIDLETEFYDKQSALQGGPFRVKVKNSWVARYFQPVR